MVGTKKEKWGDCPYLSAGIQVFYSELLPSSTVAKE